MIWQPTAVQHLGPADIQHLYTLDTIGVDTLAEASAWRYHGTDDFAVRTLPIRNAYWQQHRTQEEHKILGALGLHEFLHLGLLCEDFYLRLVGEADEIREPRLVVLGRICTAHRDGNLFTFRFFVVAIIGRPGAHSNHTRQKIQHPKHFNSLVQRTEKLSKYRKLLRLCKMLFLSYASTEPLPITVSADKSSRRIFKLLCVLRESDCKKFRRVEDDQHRFN
jgi:hypothetical protein